MKIQGRRIRNIDKYLLDIPDRTTFRIALINPSDFRSKVSDAGFDELIPDVQMLPNIVGNKSKFNAEGGFIVHRDRQKERVYRDGFIKDWHGNYHTVEIPYFRYPRTEIPPPSVELSIAQDRDNNLLIVSPEFIKGESNLVDILHVVNLFLELFGECDTVSSDDNIPLYQNGIVRRLNWTVLPKGEYPWARLRNDVDLLIENIKESYQPIVRQRFEIITSFNPNFVAIGSVIFPKNSYRY